MGADQDLMQRVASGDESAVVELYDRFESLVVRLSAQTLRNPEAVHSAVHEIFFRLRKIADRYDEKRCRLVTWVMLLSRRHLVDKLRRQIAGPASMATAAHKERSRTERFADPTDAMRFRRIRDSIDVLPELQRSVVSKAYFDGLSFEQIADELGLPPELISSVHARAIARLREQVADFAEDHRQPDFVQVSEIDAALIQYLRRNPEKMRDLPPRKFEELIAELLADMGCCDVQLTPQTRDGGRDVLVVYPTPFGKMLGLVECKRYAAERPVQQAMVERFLFTIRERDRASLGIIASTSYFTKNSQLLERDYKWQLMLKDFEHLKGWLDQYGSLDRHTEGLVWTPAEVKLDTKEMR